MDWIVWLILILLLGGYASGAVSLAPWVPTRKKDFIRIAKLAGIRNNTNFIELGCGEGSLVFYLAKKYPQANFFGVEISWFLFLLARFRKLITKQRNVMILFGNLFKIDLSNYSIIYIFGYHQSAYHKLAKKISTQASPGTKVITYSFPLPEFEPRLIDKSSSDDLAIYVYEINQSRIQKNH